MFANNMKHGYYIQQSISVSKTVCAHGFTQLFIC